MNKLLIALGFSLAAVTGAAAQSTALDAYSPPAFYTDGVDFTATASIGGAVENDQVIYPQISNDGSPMFLEPAGVAPGDSSVENSQVIFPRFGNDGSPTYIN